MTKLKMEADILKFTNTQRANLSLLEGDVNLSMEAVKLVEVRQDAISE